MLKEHRDVLHQNKDPVIEADDNKHNLQANYHKLAC